MVLSSSSIIKSGYLQQKEGSLFNRWKRYWFVLTREGKLLKFKKELEEKEDSHRSASPQPLQEYDLTSNMNSSHGESTTTQPLSLRNEIQSARNICGKNYSMAITVVEHHDSCQRSSTQTTSSSSLIMLVAENEMEYEEWFNVIYRTICGSHNSNFGNVSKECQNSVSYHMETILSAILDAAVISDSIGTILSVNDAMTTLFGFSREELIGQSVNILMPSQLARVHDDYMKRYLQRRDKKLIGKPRTLLGKRSNGVTFPVELSLGEMTNSTLEKSTPAYIAVFRSKIENDQFVSHAIDEPFNAAEMSKQASNEDGDNINSFDKQSPKSPKSPKSSVSTLDSVWTSTPHQPPHKNSLTNHTNYIEYDDLDDDPMHYTRPHSGHHKNGKISDEATATNSTNSSSPSSASTTPSSPQQHHLSPHHHGDEILHDMEQWVVESRKMNSFQHEHDGKDFELVDSLLQELDSHQTQFAQRLHSMEFSCQKTYEKEFKELELKYQTLKHHYKFMEDENKTLQQHLDCFHESLRLYQAEMSILQIGNDYMDGIMLKDLVKEDVIYRSVLKTIAKEEHQLNLLKFLRKVLKYQEQYSPSMEDGGEDRTLMEKPKSEKMYDFTNNCETEYLEKKKRMRQDATSILEKFFSFSSMVQNNDTPHEHSQELNHAQSMPLLSHSKKDTPNQSNNTNSTKINLSSTCEDLLQLHSQFPTFGMFDMAISEVMDRLKGKTFKRYIGEFHGKTDKNIKRTFK
nr:unnamed protein product [Naegleria fowleri]